MIELPDHDREGLLLYRDHGLRPGGFLYAVLSNDLCGAVARADMVNRAALADVVTWCVENLPGGAWGSPRRVEHWIELGEDARRKARGADAT